MSALTPPSNIPPPLSVLSSEICSQFPLETLADSSGQHLSLKRKFFLPNSISEPLVQNILKQHSEYYIELFTDTKRCRLSQLDLSINSVKYPLNNQNAIEKIMMHPLHTLCLSERRFLPQTFSAISNCASTLQQLDLSFVSGFKGCLVLKDLVNLVKLNLKGADIDFNRNQFKQIGTLIHLEWLDLSQTPIKMMLLEELRGLKNLMWLSLYNCTQLKNHVRFVNLLLNFKKLVHLDISKRPPESSDLNESLIIVTSHTLAELAWLPMLASLDISGSGGLKADDIIPFQKRETRLMFLGLYETGLSFRANLPADKVAGEANEEQILTALEAYQDRPEYVLLAFRKLFSLARDHLCFQLKRCMMNLVQAMERFKSANAIHIAATASLYHMTREVNNANLDPLLRRAVVEIILRSMESFKQNLQLQKNCCLALCNFKIPAEVEFMYFRVVDALLFALRYHEESYLQRISLILFNHLILHSSEAQKREVGRRGAVQTLVHIIKERIHTDETGDLLTPCWSSLWNITDEMANNCMEFFNQNGMQLFVDCLYRFPNSVLLLKNMMGVMGNIAEVKQLKPLLMEEPIIDIFISLLRSEIHLEVSYNSAGVLSHMLIEGERAWTHRYVSRHYCMQKIVEAVDSWDLRATRNINYKSFKPILVLLDHYDTPAAQHWAIWALANMASVYSTKYCKMIIEENGVEYVTRLLKSNLSPRTNQLATIVLEACMHESYLRF